MEERTPLIIALNNVRSLHNVGAIFRSCDGIRAEKVILGGLTPCPPRHEIEKTALGATKTVPWESAVDLASILEEYRKSGYHIVALEQTEGSVSLFDFKPTFPLVLVVGHEREGIEPSILSACDECIDIPMLGSSAHSLNVSTSATVALYQLWHSYTVGYNGGEK